MFAERPEVPRGLPPLPARLARLDRDLKTTRALLDDTVYATRHDYRIAVKVERIEGEWFAAHAVLDRQYYRSTGASPSIAFARVVFQLRDAVARLMFKRNQMSKN